MTPLEPYALHVGVAALLAFLAVVVAIVNWHGRKLKEHEDVLRVVSLRLDNLNKERTARDRKALQTARPPTLSEAPTVQVTEDMLYTLRKQPQAKKDGPE
jgi:Flp pilus assembly protein TadB